MLLLLLFNLVFASERIAVIDSGYNGFSSKLCTEGHYDYTMDQAVVGQDYYEHGTHIANLAVKDLDNTCLLIYKVVDKTKGTIDLSLEREIQAIYRAILSDATIINISLCGVGKASMAEMAALKYAISKGVKVFVAACNERVNLDKACEYYPPCYRKELRELNVVGALHNNKIAPYSNYGSIVNLWYDGDLSTGVRGTSFAAPRAINDYIKKSLTKQRK